MVQFTGRQGRSFWQSAGLFMDARLVRQNTKAYNLPCDYVIHTVGPIWNGGRTQEEELLESCYFNSMKVALENGIRTIAFPSISTGVYSFPVELAAKIAVKTVNRFLQDNPDSFDLVEWVLFDSHTEEIYEAAVDKTV